MKKTLGGDRLGVGKRMTIETQSYGRSTHNLSQIFRTTMSSGTLVPCLKLIALPGDTFNIGIDLDVKTHPTVGPLFGSFKAEVDVFFTPFRLYNGQAHNNKFGIGMHMDALKFPKMVMYVDPTITIDSNNATNGQVNPSSLLAYLGVRGIGTVDPAEPSLVTRDMNALGVLTYYDICKNYYFNKQEDDAYVIHQQPFALVPVDTVTLQGATIPELPATPISIDITGNDMTFVITYSGATPVLNQVIFNTNRGQIPGNVAMLNGVDNGTTITGTWNFTRTQALTLYSWNMINAGDQPIQEPTLFPFPLHNIDDMREYILTHTQNGSAFNIVADAGGIAPYSYILNWVQGLSPYMNNQEGLAVKTYLSDVYNNWINKDTIDGVNGISDITAVDTSGGDFKIETLILANKVYSMLNDIAASGGSLNDYIEVVYDINTFGVAETPIYEGGLIKELVFQEVVSNSESTNSFDGNAAQPLGTLGGRGVMARDSQRGGHVTVNTKEWGYIMAIVSLTPRIDYSQGNDWDINLQTWDDFHKPALDGIGFQDVIEEGMAWWTTTQVLGSGVWTQKSAGKQTAWQHYQTAVNKVYGNFAIPDNEMFMVINRRYEYGVGNNILDLTTYVDPAKYNYSFAQTAIDAQNFWVQISFDIEARRVMSAKIMPKL